MHSNGGAYFLLTKYNLEGVLYITALKGSRPMCTNLIIYLSILNLFDQIWNQNVKLVIVDILLKNNRK